MDKEFRFLKYSEIKEFREQLAAEQDHTCPISGEVLTEENSVLDHKHRLFKNQELGDEGGGLCRGTILNTVNSWEGRVFSSYRRAGLHKLNATLPELLRGLADYLEKDELRVVHPTEREKPDKLGKRRFKQLSKLYSEKYPKRKALEFPKSGNITVKLEKLFQDFGI